MSGIDWCIMLGTMSLIVGYGIWKTKGSQNIEGYLLGDNEAKWWTVGLSVMATQASAITFLSTPGQAYNDGMGFIQFYLSLPIAMIIICITFIPLFYKLKVYTAYEFLENRFDFKTRTLTSILFLVQRGLATGITIYAPAIILSSVLGWDLNMTAIFIGLIAICYTVSGGTKAVHVTHKHQMIVIFLGLFIIFFILLDKLPDEYSMTELLSVAGASEKLNIIDTDFNWKDRYNIWTCMIAAPFLFLSYFGTDQSQVQRYISGKSIKESRLGLLFNGLFKVPLQFFILFLGVMVFIFFQFNKAPIFFNEAVAMEISASNLAGEADRLEIKFDANYAKKKDLQEQYIAAYNAENEALKTSIKSEIASTIAEEKSLRDDYRNIITNYDADKETNDKDYIFINFILNYLPQGLIGFLFAMIFFAAMSSTASELNALASTSTVDIYKRIVKSEGNDKHYVIASKLLTLFWGLVAILFASIGTLFENLIQFVNIVGSIFYGTILGIFLVAFYFKKIKGNAVFIAAFITEILVIYIYYIDVIGYLWLNLIGVLGVIIISHIFQLFFKEEALASTN